MSGPDRLLALGVLAGAVLLAWPIPPPVSQDVSRETPDGVRLLASDPAPSLVRMPSGFFVRTAVADSERGDVNRDGRIGIADAVLVERAAVGLVALDPDQGQRADLDHDGRVGMADAMIVLGKVTGK